MRINRSVILPSPQLRKLCNLKLIYTAYCRECFIVIKDFDSFTVFLRARIKECES